MDVQHLPFENPKIYRKVQHRFVSALLVGLEPILQPVLPDLLPALPPMSQKAERRSALELRTRMLVSLLKASQLALKDVALSQSHALQPKSHSIGDILVADDEGFVPMQWELMVWAIEGLLTRTLRRNDDGAWVEDPELDFPEHNTPPELRPHFLYRLAQQLAGVERWQKNVVSRCLQNTFDELSAEHTCEQLQRHYGWGGDATSNHITKRLRLFERHEAEVLKLLAHAELFELPASWIVGQAWREQRVKIHRAVQTGRIPVEWLINWARHFDRIIEVLKAEWVDKDLRAKVEQRTKPTNNDNLFIRVSDEGPIDWIKTHRKLAEVQAQLDELRRIGHRQRDVGVQGGSNDDTAADRPPRELGDMLCWIDAHGIEDELIDAEAVQPLAAHEVPLARLPLAALFNFLDQVPRPFVKVGVLLRLIKRIPIKLDRDRMRDFIVAHWTASGGPDGNLFAQLGVKPQQSSLTEQVLAQADGLTAEQHRLAVDQALAQFDLLGWLGGETAPLPYGQLQRIANPFVRAAVTMRLLAKVVDPDTRQRVSEALVEAWDKRQSFDGGLFGFLGIDPPSLHALTDEVLAWGCGLEDDISGFVAMVDQAMANMQTGAKVVARHRGNA